MNPFPPTRTSTGPTPETKTRHRIRFINSFHHLAHGLDRSHRETLAEILDADPEYDPADPTSHHGCVEREWKRCIREQKESLQGKK